MPGPRGGRAAPLEADALAVQALAFLAAEPERLGQFLALTGIDPAGLRAGAGTPAFARGVLSYLMSDERLLLDFSAGEGLDPARVHAAALAALGEG